jgi:hypothetical protein
VRRTQGAMGSRNVWLICSPAGQPAQTVLGKVMKMEKKLAMAGIALVMALAFGAPALALAPMGPPTAGLNQGQFRAGADYSYSEMDLELDADNPIDDGTIQDLESNMVFANLGYGVMSNWEAFVQLGVANVEFDKIKYDDGEVASGIGFDGDYGFAWGFGTKYTFWEQMENLHWGILFQMKWVNSEDTLAGAEVEDLGDGVWEIETIRSDAEFDYYEMQIAVGPTWEAMEGFCIYGGPFLHMVSGDLDNDFSETVATYDNPNGAGTPLTGPTTLSGKESSDLEEESTFGGYVGAQLDVTEQMQVFAEVMFTGDAWGIGGGGGWLF